MGLVKRRSPAAQVQGKRWPSVFPHAMGHDVFRRKRQRGGCWGVEGKRGEERKEKKNPLKESGGHMSSLLLGVLVSQDLMLKIDTEDVNKVD